MALFALTRGPMAVCQDQFKSQILAGKILAGMCIALRGADKIVKSNSHKESGAA